LRKNLKSFAITIFIIVLALSLVGCNRDVSEVVSLADQNIELTIGQERTITTTIEETKLQWNTSDPGVATVENGLITGVNFGEATITIRMDGEDLAKIFVTVVKPDPMSIEVFGEDKMYIGQSISLIAKVNPAEADYSVSWRSGDEEIAEVSEDGVVTSKTFGTVRIYAEAHNLSAYKEITVLKDDPTAIVINGPVQVPLDETYTYTITPTHLDASDEVIWTTSDEEVATITVDGTLHPHKEGTITLTAVSVRSDEVKDSIKVEIYGKVASIEYTIPDEFVVGGFTTLQSTLIPEDEDLELNQENVIYESSNPEIITIDEEGNIIGVSPGEATITAFAKFNPEIKLETVVTVFETVSTESVIILSDYEENESFIYNEASYVKGHNAFTSIQDAINKIDGGSTISLTSATYNEDLLISKDNITITASDDTFFTGKILVDADNFTIENINFIDAAHILNNDAVKGFSFVNNEVNIKSESEFAISFIDFYSSNNNNVDFVIEDNMFIGENINSFISVMNAENLSIVNNSFTSMTGKAVFLRGSTGSNSSGAGANGDINIHDNVFDDFEDGALVITRYSDANIDINNNTFTNINGQPLYFEVGAGEFTNLNIYNNELNEITAEIGIEFIYSAVPTDALDIKIHYNRFLSFTHEEFTYIDFASETNLIGYAEYNYFDVPADENNTNNANYENQYETIEALEAGIEEFEENLDE